MPKRKNFRTPEEDHKAFIAAAREVGAELSDTDFAEAVKKVASTPSISNAAIVKKRRKKK